MEEVFKYQTWSVVYFVDSERDSRQFTTHIHIDDTRQEETGRPGKSGQKQVAG